MHLADGKDRLVVEGRAIKGAGMTLRTSSLV